MTGRRRTGRPTLPDTALLERLADAVIDDPDTKVAPFVRRLIAAAPGAIAVHSADAMVRRIQHKWRLEGARLLARRRHAIRQDALRVSCGNTGESFVRSALREAHARAERLLHGAPSGAASGSRHARDAFLAGFAAVDRQASDAR